MGFSKIWAATTEDGTASGYLELKSDGWSEKAIDRSAQDLEDRKFQFDVEFEMTSTKHPGITGDIHTTEESYGYISYDSEQGIIGISLEHMGKRQRTHSSGAHAPYDAYNIQLIGWVNFDEATPGTNTGVTEAWGSESPYTALSYRASSFSVTNLEGVSVENGDAITRADVALTSLAPVAQNGDMRGNKVLDQWICSTSDTEPTTSTSRGRKSHAVITTDLPIFATDAELLAWCADPTNPATIAAMLNPPADPEEAAEEAYDVAQAYYYIRNKYSYKTNSSALPETVSNNFNIKPYGEGRICFFKAVVRINGVRYTRYSLKGIDSYNYECKTAPWNDFRWSDNDTDVAASYVLSHVNTTVGYVRSSGIYGTMAITKIYEATNIPLFANEDLANKYINHEINIDMALNYDEIMQEEHRHLLPPWGEEDTDGDNGSNSQACDIGHRMYMLSEEHLRNFFDRIYDPTNLSAILDNNGLFGENQMNSILGLIFIPVNADKFATMGSQENIKLGGWDSTIQGKVIQKNNKLWDVGSTFLTPVFNDFRDMEPYQQLFISLPYCGLHALNLSKYLGKTLSVKYACDLGTGQCCAHIYANGVEYDAFDGNMASQRPITAIDQQAYTSAMMRSITGMIDPAVDLVTGAVESGVGAATGQIGMVAAGGASAIGSIPRMAMNAIESKQDLIQKPMTFKGGFFGAIGFFGNQRCHLIVAQRNTVRATNELSLIGYPSGYGGTVSNFSGHLKCASFTLAQGFGGTAEEAAEIVAMMEQGVYL